MQLLGLPDKATDDEVRAKYGEVYNDYQLRLTNAPTPNLKKLYQKNLEELNDALQVILGGGAGTVMRDLPSSAPVYDSGASALPPQRASTAQRPNAGPQGRKPASKGGGASWGLVYGLGVGAVVLLTAAAFFGLRNVAIQKEMEELRVTAEQYEQAKVQLASQDLDMKRYAQEKLKVRNKGQRPFTIVSVIATYKDGRGEFKKYESLWRQEVGAGATVELNKFEGGRVIWDGSAIAFSFGISYGAYPCPFIHGGLVSNENRDGVISLNFDSY